MATLNTDWERTPELGSSPCSNMYWDKEHIMMESKRSLETLNPCSIQTYQILLKQCDKLDGQNKKGKQQVQESANKEPGLHLWVNDG